jgi:hypothetical protein
MVHQKYLFGFALNGAGNALAVLRAKYERA